MSSEISLMPRDLLLEIEKLKEALIDEGSQVAKYSNLYDEAKARVKELEHNFGTLLVLSHEQEMRITDAKNLLGEVWKYHRQSLGEELKRKIYDFFQIK